LVVLVVILRRGAGQTPVALGHAGATPVSILRRDGAWYWLEQTKPAQTKQAKPGIDRLVRATDAGIKTIASAEALPRYAVEDGRMAWSARQDGRWSIFAAAAN